MTPTHLLRTDSFDFFLLQSSTRLAIRSAARKKPEKTHHLFSRRRRSNGVMRASASSRGAHIRARCIGFASGRSSNNGRRSIGDMDRLPCSRRHDNTVEVELRCGYSSRRGASRVWRAARTESSSSAPQSFRLEKVLLCASDVNLVAASGIEPPTYGL